LIENKRVSINWLSFAENNSKKLFSRLIVERNSKFFYFTKDKSNFEKKKKLPK